MTTNQTAPVTDEELDHLIWGLERYGLYPRQLAALKELREVRRAKAPTALDEQSFWDWLRDKMPTTYRWSRELEDTPENSALITKGKASALDMLSAWKGCSAAMLQLPGNSEQLEPVSNRDELPFEQWLSQQEGSIDVDCGCVMTEVLFHWMRVAYEAGNCRENEDSSTRYFREISETSTNEHVRREYRASDEQVVLREYRTNHSVWIQCSKQAYESRKGEGCEVRELYERPQAGNSPVTPDGWIPVSEKMPDPKSELRVCVYTPNPHEDIRYRFVPASLFKAVCRDATHWHYMSAPKEVG